MSTRPHGSDKYFALAAQLTRALGRAAIAVTVARLAGAHIYAAFVLLIAIEVIVLGMLNAMFASPMATLAPGRQPEHRDAHIAYAIRSQRRAGIAVALILLLGIPLAIHEPIGLTAYLGFCATVAAGADLQARRSAGLCLFHANRVLVAEGIALSIPLLAAVGAARIGTNIADAVWWGAAAGAWIGARFIHRHDDSVANGNFPNKRDARELGHHMMLGSLVYSAGSRFHPLIVGTLAGSIAVATFGAALTLAAPLRILAASIAGTLRPRLALRINAGDAKQARPATNLILLTLATIGLLATLGASAFGGLLIEHTFGPAISQLAPVLPWAVAYCALAATSSVMVVGLQVQGRAPMTTKLRAIGSATSLVTAWPLIAAAGPIGAFAAMILGEAVVIAAGLQIQDKQTTEQTHAARERSPASPGVTIGSGRSS